MTFGEGEANEKILESNAHTAGFVARYNPDGTLAWAVVAGGDDLDSSPGAWSRRGRGGPGRLCHGRSH